MRNSQISLKCPLCNNDAVFINEEVGIMNTSVNMTNHRNGSELIREGANTECVIKDCCCGIAVFLTITNGKFWREDQDCELLKTKYGIVWKFENADLHLFVSASNVVAEKTIADLMRNSVDMSFLAHS